MFNRRMTEPPNDRHASASPENGHDHSDAREDEMVNAHERSLTPPFHSADDRSRRDARKCLFCISLTLSLILLLN